MCMSLPAVREEARGRKEKQGIEGDRERSQPFSDHHKPTGKSKNFPKLKPVLAGVHEAVFFMIEQSILYLTIFSFIYNFKFRQVLCRCYGLNCAHPKIHMPEVLTLSNTNVTLFGNSVTAGIIT